jgi:hypothetical protein
MKTMFSTIALLAVITITANAQEFKETVQPLSVKAQKGYLYDVSKDVTGNSNVTYKMKLDKKSEDVSYEKYSFDKDLKFIGATDVQVAKEQKEDKEHTFYYANVGGSTSFDVLSMKLKLTKVVRLLTWNHDNQRYVTKKTISNETIKPRNDAGKVYLGYASYVSDDDAKSDVFVLAKADTKDKSLANIFYILQFNSNLELKEKAIDLQGAYSLVYCEQLQSEDVVMVFAPKKGSADVSKYVYYRFDIEGNQKDKAEFTSPASALAISAAYEKDGNVYFFGTSTKSNKSYEDVFNEYAPISSPGFTQGGNNYTDLKWRNSVNETMDNFHLLKFTGSKLDFSSTTPVADFKAKFKTAPDDKGATAYKGKKFFIESFYVTPAEEYLVAGQLSTKVNMGSSNIVDAYEDIVCFHFDKTGNLKAQYGIGKMNNDKKSEIFDMVQAFYPSSDGKSIYWELMEIKGAKGYESFMDAYNGDVTFYPLYFPRIVKIDLGNSSLGTIKVLGDEKYFLRKNFTSQFDKTENSITYIGQDEDWKKLWIGKVQL